MTKDSPLYQYLLSELLAADFDNQSTKDEKYAEQLLKVHAQFVKRNGKLSDLLDDFIIQRKKRVKTNNFLKKFVFWFFAILLGLLTVAVVVFVIRNKASDTIPAMVSLLTVSLTYLASLIAVFEIISKYLFPLDEEKDTISMIQTVINNDVKVEELMSKEIKKDSSVLVERLKELKQLLDEGVLTNEEFDELKKMFLENITCS